MRSGRRGFTLVELMVVLAVLGTLLALSAPRFIGTVDRAKEVALKHNLKVIREGLDKYKGYEGQFPDRLQDLVEKGYLKEVPMDPYTENSGSWKPVLEMGSDGEKKIVDVRSTSTAAASSGEKVSTW